MTNDDVAVAAPSGETSERPDRSLATGQVEAHPAEVYGASLSRDTTPKITNPRSLQRCRRPRDRLVRPPQVADT